MEFYITLQLHRWHCYCVFLWQRPFNYANRQPQLSDKLNRCRSEWVVWWPVMPFHRSLSFIFKPTHSTIYITHLLCGFLINCATPLKFTGISMEPATNWATKQKTITYHLSSSSRSKKKINFWGKAWSLHPKQCLLLCEIFGLTLNRVLWSLSGKTRGPLLDRRLEISAETPIYDRQFTSQT